MAAGRPTLFNQALADAICQRISEGESLRSICRDEKMPAIASVMNWLNRAERKEPEFAPFLEQYTQARENQAEFYAEEIVTIADAGSDDVQRDRLRVDARKWVASKLKPKKYGERVQQEITGKDGKAIEVKDTSITDAARKIAFVLAKASASQD